MYGALDISTSALVAHRTNLDVIAGNIAMKEVVRDEAGNSQPYQRRVALYAPKKSGGVKIAAVVGDPTPFPLKWAPGHPNAIQEGKEKGYLRVSNVDVHTEMVNAMAVARAYEANITVMETAKSMAAATLRLIA